jgi:hypothetical protein
MPAVTREEIQALKDIRTLDYSVDSMTEAQFRSFFMSESFEKTYNHENLDFGVSVPYKGVPVKFGYAERDDRSWQKWHESRHDSHWDFRSQTNVRIRCRTETLSDAALAVLAMIVYARSQGGGILLTPDRGDTRSCAVLFTWTAPPQALHSTVEQLYVEFPSRILSKPNWLQLNTLISGNRSGAIVCEKVDNPVALALTIGGMSSSCIIPPLPKPVSPEAAITELVFSGSVALAGGPDGPNAWVTLMLYVEFDGREESFLIQTDRVGADDPQCVLRLKEARFLLGVPRKKSQLSSIHIGVMPSNLTSNTRDCLALERIMVTGVINSPGQPREEIPLATNAGVVLLAYDPPTNAPTIPRRLPLRMEA